MVLPQLPPEVWYLILAHQADLPHLFRCRAVNSTFRSHVLRLFQTQYIPHMTIILSSTNAAKVVLNAFIMYLDFWKFHHDKRRAIFQNLHSLDVRSPSHRQRHLMEAKFEDDGHVWLVESLSGGTELLSMDLEHRIRRTMLVPVVKLGVIEHRMPDLELVEEGGEISFDWKEMLLQFFAQEARRCSR